MALLARWLSDVSWAFESHDSRLDSARAWKSGPVCKMVA